MKEDFLEELFQLIEKRKKADSNDSYVKYLQEAGTSKINEKILEETLELLEASSETTKDKKEIIIHETADLWFHVMVLLSNQDIELDEIVKELQSRFGTSGHIEKASRSSSEEEK
jgi:phosphoribosyl-ATP pyrophosphohydrolase